MGTASIVLGILGICIGWLPLVGWLGVVLGLLAWVLGVPSVTRWYGRPGYGPWGISGIILGLLAFWLSLAYQIKHAAPKLDGLVVSLEGVLPFAILVLSSAVIAVGLTLARKRPGCLILGEVLAFVGIAAMGLTGAWTLTTADRHFEGEKSAVVEFQ